MMSSGLRQFVSEEFCEVWIHFSFCGSFCCHFVKVVLQKKRYDDQRKRNGRCYILAVNIL